MAIWIWLVLISDLNLRHLENSSETSTTWTIAFESPAKILWCKGFDLNLLLTSANYTRWLLGTSNSITYLNDILLSINDFTSHERLHCIHLNRMHFIIWKKMYQTVCEIYKIPNAKCQSHYTIAKKPRSKGPVNLVVIFLCFYHHEEEKC